MVIVLFDEYIRRQKRSIYVSLLLFGRTGTPPPPLPILFLSCFEVYPIKLSAYIYASAKLLYATIQYRSANNSYMSTIAKWSSRPKDNYADFKITF